jgi:hypothetical protein
MSDEAISQPSRRLLRFARNDGKEKDALTRACE